MLTMASTVVMVVRPPQHDPVVALIGSAAFVLSYMLLLIGYARFLLRPPLWWPTIAILSIYIVALVWFTLAAPQPGLREIGMHTSELQSLMRISYAVFRLKKTIIIQLII